MKKVSLFILTVIIFNFANANYTILSKSSNAIIAIEDFEKIKSSELPPAVVEQILKEFPTSKLRQAYRNKQNKYKLIMVLASGSTRTVYIDTYGRWITKKINK